MPSSPSPLQEPKQPKYLTSQTAPDNEELSRFRKEWLSELQQRKTVLQGTNAPHGVIAPPSGATSVAAKVPIEEAYKGLHSPARGRALHEVTSLHRETVTPKPVTPRTNHPAVKNGSLMVEMHMPPALRSALEVYRRAADYEQSGNLDEAIVLYRQAFRLHENVDRAFRRDQMLRSIVNERDDLAKRSEDEVEDLAASFQSAVTIRPSSKPAIVSGTLATILQGFPAELKFEPENEKEGVILNMLPEEMVVLIISKLDPNSIERFACVSRKARVLALDSGIWRELVRRTYKPPQIPELEVMLPVVERYLFDFRRVYIEQPRVRLDGVYIAICHYIRPGLSENHWVNVTHLITYHRYLRFFANGQVLSLLANEEKSPQEVIPILKPTIRMKGLFVGHWKLLGTTVHISGLVDASGKFALPGAFGDDGVSQETKGASAGGTAGLGHHAHGHLVPLEQARYTFDMTLHLRSRPLGRWNRMDIQSYDSVHLETGDVNPVALKHERPFWFSKVRSYG
ncbi:hypothetical protein CPB83DRAFT_850941 [Crepidotus variabilis]|uniref:F-box only protein 9 n=1 Tax=Crepidotus variabilis TaxID=179855 RepID=A0A9P6JR69_9AGAR|nr:hypothetical protein CPB83DRAFT_850941 [Crepidotus variabilis]